MKKIGLFLIAAMAVFAFTSCNDSDNDYYTGSTLITVVPVENSNYYFRQDNGKTVYPSINLVSGYEIPKEEQRAIIYYSLLDSQQEGYDHNIKLFGIENILTKNVVLVDSQNELDEIGDDPIDVNRVWVGDGYINIIFEFPFNPTSKPHYINVIQNNVDKSTPNQKDYITLELRHNAYGDTKGYSYQGIAAFNINDIINSSYKGIYLRVKNTSGNIIFQKIELEEGYK